MGAYCRVGSQLYLSITLEAFRTRFGVTRRAYFGIAIAERTSILETLNNLGSLYVDQGRLVEAEKMYQRALVGCEEALGPEHASTLLIVDNLGTLHRAQGRLTDAENMYDSNLGALYADQGHLGDAEKMYDHALAGFEKALGTEHTSTLKTVNNLGALYADQGRMADAEEMYHRALAGCEKALGAEHTSTLSTLSNLGTVYAAQGRLADAEDMYNFTSVPSLDLRRHWDQCTNPLSTRLTTSEISTEGKGVS